ncbi:uncharacterized protein LOC142903394 [Nelusetta ayraudi]|uniref:uncharacterized protein LOC142903394 n=1 Tax=Nelusetta ayraudi TaxID=303726 RepID=UPI003F6E7D98
MPQPGLNGMEPAFGEAYGGHRGLLSPYPLAMSPQGGRTEYDQSVLLMLGSPALSRKRPFELLSDLVDDGSFGEDLQPERWDVSALDEMTRFTKLGLGVGGELLAYSEEAVLLGRWGTSCEEVEEEQEERRRGRGSRLTVPAANQEVQTPAGEAERGGGSSVGTAEEPVMGRGSGGGGGAGAGGPSRQRTVEVYQVAQEEEEVAAAAAAGLALEHCNEEHNYSLSQGEELGAGGRHGPQQEVEEEEEEEEEEAQQEAPCGQASQSRSERNTEDEEQQLEEEEEEEDEEEEEEEEDEVEEEEEGEETAVEEAELSSSSESECEAVAEEAEPAKEPGERPSKRRCFWEYRRSRETATKKKLGGDVRWSLSWSSSTLPSTLYRREGKKGRRKARKTDASDLTPNPQKLHSIGEQLQKLNAAIDGMGPVNELPAVARARSRKEKNKLASRACRLKKKAQHEANKIKLWGLNQEYENLLGALLRIKEVIRRRVESSEEDDVDERGMTRRLEDILRESSGPLVAGRTKDFVQRILAASASGGQNQRKEPQQRKEEESAA